MADTGQDRESKQFVEAHQAELARESKNLVAKIKERLLTGPEAKKRTPKQKKTGTSIAH